MSRNMSIKIKNKKGDIPITILVIGVLGVCILTLFSFSNGVNKQEKTFVGPGLIETIYSIQEQIKFGNFGEEILNPFEKKGVKINFEENEINAEYFGKGKVLISIKYEPIE